MLKRKLIFYRWTSVAGKSEFSPVAVADRLAQGILDDREYSIIENEGVITAVELVSRGGQREPTSFRLLALRGVDDRPFKWDPQGSVSPIALLDNEYPADVAHVSLWNDGYCAQDVGRYTPRLSRLAFFFRQRMSEFVSFDPLYNEEAFRRLEEMAGQLRSFDLAMTKPEYATRSQGTFQNLWPSEKLPSVRVSLGMGKYGPRDRYIDQDLEEEVFELAARASDLLTGMIVTGRSKRTNRVEKVNLLSERLGYEVEFPRSNTIPSTPKVEAVFHELDQAYKRYKEDNVFETTTTALMMHKD